MSSLPHANVLPPGASLTAGGALAIAGCDTVDLVERFGTPLYVYDEDALRQACREFRAEFTSRYEQSEVAYAGKAFMSVALLQLLAEEGLSLDVVSGGELAIASAAGFPMAEPLLPRQQQEPRRARAGRRCRHWPRRRRQLPRDRLARAACSADAALPSGSSSAFRQTSTPTPTKRRRPARSTPSSASRLRQARLSKPCGVFTAHRGSTLVGYHFHIGSPIFETGPYIEAVEVVSRFAATVQREHRFHAGALEHRRWLRHRLHRRRPPSGHRRIRRSHQRGDQGELALTRVSRGSPSSRGARSSAVQASPSTPSAARRTSPASAATSPSTAA